MKIMFQQLFNMLNDGQILTITLLRQGEKLTVGVLPQAPSTKDNAKSQIIPLSLIGTPAELDEGFLESINTPVRKATGILLNMELFEEKAEKAASESKALKEKTEKINKAIKDAEALEQTKPREALLAYKKIQEQDKYNSKVINKIKALEKTLSEGSLFDNEEVKVIVPPVTIEDDKASQPEQDENFQSNQTREQKPVDMFSQAVAASQLTKTGTQNDPIVNNATNMAFDPDKYNQFLQFMAMQEASQQ